MIWHTVQGDAAGPWAATVLARLDWPHRYQVHAHAYRVSTFCAASSSATTARWSPAAT